MASVEQRIRLLSEHLPRDNALRRAIDSVPAVPSVASTGEDAKVMPAPETRFAAIPAYDGTTITIPSAHGRFAQPLLDKQADALLCVAMQLKEDTVHCDGKQLEASSELLRMYAWLRGYVEWCHAGNGVPFITDPVPRPKNLPPALQAQVDELALVCMKGQAAAAAQWR